MACLLRGAQQFLPCLSPLLLRHIGGPLKMVKLLWSSNDNAASTQLSFLRLRCACMCTHTRSPANPDIYLQRTENYFAVMLCACNVAALCSNVSLSQHAADMLRVGPLRRLDKRLLPHSLHCSQVTKGPSEAVAELQAMLQEAASSADTAVIHAELEQVCQLEHSALFMHAMLASDVCLRCPEKQLPHAFLSSISMTACVAEVNLHDDLQSAVTCMHGTLW